jgi:hypothetical protein
MNRHFEPARRLHRAIRLRMRMLRIKTHDELVDWDERRKELLKRANAKWEEELRRASSLSDAEMDQLVDSGYTIFNKIVRTAIIILTVVVLSAQICIAVSNWMERRAEQDSMPQIQQTTGAQYHV